MTILYLESSKKTIVVEHIVGVSDVNRSIDRNVIVDISMSGGFCYTEKFADFDSAAKFHSKIIGLVSAQ